MTVFEAVEAIILYAVAVLILSVLHAIASKIGWGAPSIIVLAAYGGLALVIFMAVLAVTYWRRAIYRKGGG